MQDMFKTLEKELEGLLFYDESPLHRAQLMAYSTDASVYQEKPAAVVLPRSEKDLERLIHFAHANALTLIPRAAGTSLAGQVVGNGIVVDISCFLNRILELNTEERWVRVQPGVIRDDLNYYLRPYGLMYGPETSTANRAMIGGMLGNNSCGLHSIVWGAARDHVLGVTALLSDGSKAEFAAESPRAEHYSGKKGSIYRELDLLLSDKLNQEIIRQHTASPKVHRRNTGYALDVLLNMFPYKEDGEPFNCCKLLAGSEGTLAFVTEIRLNLLPLPPQETAVVCIHCHSVVEAMHANILALTHQPMAAELVDKYIMDFTSGHPEYGKNRFFIEGDPEAILMVEFMEHTQEEAAAKAGKLVANLQKEKLGFAWPVLFNEQTKAAWDVRKAGLGLLRNMKGDAQPVNLIEDCAVSTDDLPAYISELQELLARHQVKASYYAHAAAGELHVEPLLNLRTAEGLRTFRSILAETAELVKKYRGSLSGEHGDGRLRGEFIPAVVGTELYSLFKRVKQIFDPAGVFNAGKITDTPAMDTQLRVAQQPVQKKISTYFDFSATEGILRLAEKCSGSGDCRKMPVSGGVMCPSYMATRLEKDTTRARANLLRQFLSDENKEYPFDHPELKEILDLCLSCKGCKTECPSAVDVAKMKAEFLQHFYDRHGVPFRSRLIARFSSQMRLVSLAPSLFNGFYAVPWLRRFANQLVGFHPDRTMPALSRQTLRNWMRKRKTPQEKNTETGRIVWLFCDEFTNYNDADMGRKAVLLLEKLGYTVRIPEHGDSGRTWLSKGLVKEAKRISNENIRLLRDKVSGDTPLLGLEPSGILTFRDEYIDLAEPELRETAREMARHCYTIEEFLSAEFKAGRINRNLFTKEKKKILIHGHCYQKALSGQQGIRDMLGIPENFITELIPSGCCGMAGAFGYEKEHYAVSQQVGELVLFPAVRNAPAETIIAASGTSCRHQIKDGTGKLAQHPVEILYDALN